VRLTLVNADLPSATPVPPLGLVSLAHTAIRAGHEVTLRDYQLAPVDGSRDPEVFASFCDTLDDVLGISTSSMALPLVVAALERIKARRPKIVTVLGGIGAAGVAQRIVAQFPWIDYVCRGEGEKALRELLDRLETRTNTSTLDGFVCRLEGKPLVNLLPERIKDLDCIEAHAWDYLDLSRYKLINVASSRGCPFPCTFCDVAPYWQRQHTVRSIGAVVNEIRAIQDRLAGPLTFVFVDDTLTIDRRRMEALCRELGALPHEMQWACYARADTLDENILKLMAECGCRKIYLGLESGSNHVLRDIRKGFDAETGRQTALMAREHIPIVQAAFVWGFPFETWSDFYETLLLMAYLVAHGVSVKANVLTPLPFSALYAKYADSMRFLPDYSPQLHLAGYESHPELVELICKHPRIFPCFYLYESDMLTQKYDLLRNMGLSPEQIWDVWELMKAPVPLREKGLIPRVQL